jgi:hypothetical protein
MLEAMDLKAGRNEPCPCGSGKKYKKCCMQIHQGIEQANKNLKERFLIFSKEPRFQVDFKEATDIFFEGREPDEADKIMFVNWFTHDYKLKYYEKTIIEVFYQENLQNLSPQEKVILEERRNSIFGTYEVTGIERGRGVYLKGLFDSTEKFVNDVNCSKGVSKWDVVTLRVITMVDKYYLSGGTYVLPPGGKDEIIRYGEDEFIEFRKTNPEAT